MAALSLEDRHALADPADAALTRCMKRSSGLTSPSAFVSANPSGDWHAEPRHPMEHAAALTSRRTSGVQHQLGGRCPQPLAGARTPELCPHRLTPNTNWGHCV